MRRPRPDALLARKRKRTKRARTAALNSGHHRPSATHRCRPRASPSPTPTITRGPLTVHRAEFSLGIDHAAVAEVGDRRLCSGVSRTRLHRSQSEMAADAEPGSHPTRERQPWCTRAAPPLAITLTHLPAAKMCSSDARLSVQAHLVNDERLVNDLALFFRQHARPSGGPVADGWRQWRYANGVIGRAASRPRIRGQPGGPAADELQGFVDTGEGPFPASRSRASTRRRCRPRRCAASVGTQHVVRHTDGRTCGRCSAAAASGWRRCRGHRAGRHAGGDGPAGAVQQRSVTPRGGMLAQFPAA